MCTCPFCGPQSPFMTTQVPRFIERFALSYFCENTCTEYFIESLSTHRVISSALVLSHNVFGNKLHVSRFYPELFKRQGTKYMSAVAFYLMIHHFSQTQHLDDNCLISLDTTNDVYDDFYSQLQDFHFHIQRQMVGNNVALESDYSHEYVDVSMVHEQETYSNSPHFLISDEA